MTSPPEELARTEDGAVLLDNRSAPCAIGLIKAAKLMSALPPGSVLEIWSKDRFAPMEITVWAERERYEVRRLPDAGRWPGRHYVFRIAKP